VPQAPTFWQRVIPVEWRLRVYRLAFHRGFLDILLNDYIVRPFVAVFRWCDGMERRWTDLLAGAPSRESDAVSIHGGVADELA